MGGYNPLSQSRESSEEEEEALVQKAATPDYNTTRSKLAWLSIFAVSFVAFILGILSSHLISYIRVSSGIQGDGRKVLVQCMFRVLADLRGLLVLTCAVPDEVFHFRENEAFMEDSSEESDALWQSLIPGRGGRQVVSIISAPYLITWTKMRMG